MVGADIGGSMVKLLYCSKYKVELPDYVIIDSHLDGPYPIISKNEAVVHFVKVPITELKSFYQFLKQLNQESLLLCVTGGGAIKYDKYIRQLGIEFRRQDEIASIVYGVNYAINNFPNEISICDWKTKTREISKEKINVPYLLVNIGSGVSIISVEEKNCYKRLTGTSIGGGTFWALCRLLTNIENFDQVEQYSDSGDNKELDLLVKDIYGGDYLDIGLEGHVIASNLAKINTNDRAKVNECNLVKSLLYMVSNNITQIAYLSVQNDHRYKDVIFTGSFTRIGPVLWKKLDYGVDFWSKGTMKAKFLRHEGYLGAIGASIIGE